MSTKKGFAHYWNVRAGGRVHRNVAWTYPLPLPAAHQIAAMICCYQEKTHVRVDGARP